MATKVDWGEAGDYLLVGGPAHGVSFPHYGALPDRINVSGKAYAKGSDADRDGRWVAVYYADSIHPEFRLDWLAAAEDAAERSVRL